jgi:hypothetical protein
MKQRPDKIAIATDDPSLPDPTRLGQRYGPADLTVHEQMRAVGRAGNALAVRDGKLVVCPLVFGIPAPGVAGLRGDVHVSRAGTGLETPDAPGVRLAPESSRVTAATR